MEGQATGPSVSVEYQHLLQAISVRAAPIVHQLVRQFPGIVHQKGWNGQTPLHKVCLSGDWTITYLLLEAGADPNTRNDSEETPLHLACKRGDVSVVHLLIQHKGDITAVDKSGMGMMHHAAQTCSVYVFHYLSAIHGQSFGVDTNKHQTPLHICCDFGSSDIAVKYLLRKDRSDVTATDSSGNTPLHLAANQGHAFISWLLLLAGGLKMLHLTNNNGDTPVALAKAGNKLTHKYLHGVLQQLSSLPCVGYPTVPRCVWYGHLVMPGVVYALAVLVAQMVGAPYQGFIILTGLGYIIYSVRGHTHRIMHISRSPNPVFAGAFAAGVVHTFIMYCLILPYIYDYLLLTIVSVSLAAVTLYLYIRLLRENAGITKTSVFLENSSERKTLLDLVGPPAKLGLFCPDCEIVHASNSKHCRLCDCCYEEMDHHCLFLMNCIAKSNRLMFVWFLIVVSLCKIVFVLNAMLYCSFLYKPPLSTDLIGDMFKSNAWLLSLVILNIVSCVFSINTAWFQISLVSLGLTTFLRPSKPETVLTTTERIINAIYFLQGKPIFVKDPLFDV